MAATAVVSSMVKSGGCVDDDATSSDGGGGGGSGGGRPPLRIDLSIVNGPNDEDDGGVADLGFTGNHHMLYRHHHPHQQHHHHHHNDGNNSPHSTYRLEGLSIGQDFLRYEGATTSQISPSTLTVESTIGRGMCSVVRRARHVATREPFALKLFPVRGVHNRVRRDMLEKELRALCSLDCDCLVRLVGAFFDGEEGTITMVLEYMDRGSLLDFLTADPDTDSVFNSSHPHTQRRQEQHGEEGGPSPSHPSSPSSPCPRYGDDYDDDVLQSSLYRGRAKLRALPERTVASVAYQVLWGVAYLHYENILHRDIKPANVLVNSAGEVKLSDFGIAAKRSSLEDGGGDGEGDETGGMNCTVVGTTRYMSPERLRARPYGVPSDVWSLGLVLLECATGRSPFENISSMVELVLTVEESTVDDLIPSFLSDGLRELLAGCLQQIPEKRIPADILIASPWFASHGIASLEDAVSVMREYIETTYAPQDPECLSMSTMRSLLKNQQQQQRRGLEESAAEVEVDG